LYDEVATYDDIENLAEWAPTIYVDIAGNNSVTTRVHAHFSDALQHSMKIGATHWDQGGQLGDLAGPIPQFFFAPTQLAKRGKEWGRDVLNTRLESSLRTFIDDSNRWLHVEESRGGDELMRVYHSLISGESRPELGHIIIP
ncbi:MAG: hypothetical protein RIR69_134, partial [Actinomycetota bacterium]